MKSKNKILNYFLILILFSFFINTSAAHALMCSQILSPSRDRALEALLDIPWTNEDEDLVDNIKYDFKEGRFRIPRNLTRNNSANRRNALIFLMKKQRALIGKKYTNNYRGENIEDWLDKWFALTWTNADDQWLHRQFPNVESLLDALFGPSSDAILGHDRAKNDYRARHWDYAEQRTLTWFARQEWNTFLDYFYFGITTHEAQSEDQVKDPSDQNRWLGLETDHLNTDYQLIRSILQDPRVRSSKKIIDMGSGFGRFGLYIGASRPDINFVGYEYYKHRITPAQKSAKRLGYKNIRFEQTDFAAKETEIEPADVYITYYSNKDTAIMKTMFDKIWNANPNQKFRVVAIHVRHVQELVKVIAPWLKPIASNTYYTVYESTGK